MGGLLWYARTTYTDVDRDETFWADFDQRHTLNIFGALPVRHTHERGSDLPCRQQFSDSRVPAQR